MFDIARGKYKPKPGEPRIWFTAMKSLAEVLSDENRALPRVITETKPESIAALAGRFLERDNTAKIFTRTRAYKQQGPKLKLQVYLVGSLPGTELDTLAHDTSSSAVPASSHFA